MDDLDDSAASDWRDGVLRVLHDLDARMFKEDFGPFPAAIATLAGDEWDAMDRWEQVNLGAA